MRRISDKELSLKREHVVGLRDAFSAHANLPRRWASGRMLGTAGIPARRTRHPVGCPLLEAETETFRQDAGQRGQDGRAPHGPIAQNFQPRLKLTMLPR